MREEIISVLGTGVAIIVAPLRAMQQDAGAVVAFFPSVHCSPPSESVFRISRIRSKPSTGAGIDFDSHDSKVTLLATLR